MITKVKRLIFVLALLLLSACKLNQPLVEPTATKQPSIDQVSVEPTLVEPSPNAPTPTQEGPPDCTLLQESSLRALGFGQLRAEPMQEWLENRSPFNGTEISSSRFNNHIGALSWEQAGVKYVARFQEGPLNRIWMSWQDPTTWLTGDEVLACLGEPDLYGTVHTSDPEGSYIQLTFWYLTEGVVMWFDEDQLRTTALSPLDGRLLVDGMTFVAPGPAEEMIRNTFEAGKEYNFRAQVLESLDPWPGSWKKIRISSIRF